MDFWQPVHRLGVRIVRQQQQRSRTQNTTEATHSCPTERNDSILAPPKYHAHFLTSPVQRLQLYRSAVKLKTKVQQDAEKVASTQIAGFITVTNKVLPRAL